MKALFYYLTIVSIPFTLSAQWTTLPLNTGYQNHSMSFINKDTGYVCNGIFQGPPPGINHTKLLKTTDGGQTWLTVVDDYTNTPISDMHYVTENLGIYRKWQDNVMKTTNGGVTGTAILSGLGGGSGDRIQVLDSLKYFYARNNTVYATQNGGTSWTTKSTLAFQNFNNNNIFYTEFDNLKNGFVYGSVLVNLPSFHTEYAVYKTTDSCQTLQPSYYSATPNATGGIIKLATPAIAIMTFNNMVLKTQDFGTTWDTVYTFSGTEKTFGMDVKNNVVVISGNLGTILVSTNYGTTFQTGFVGSSLAPISFCIADANFAIIYGRANTRLIKMGSYVASVSEKEKPVISVYPNPAGSCINLRYGDAIPKDIEIYDITGSLVKSLSLKATATAWDKIMIDDLNSGCYIIKITSGTQSSYLKFIKE
ncbi:MAG: T9SS type A sorting domain-containing protein [Bacteroidota bacterium]